MLAALGLIGGIALIIWNKYDKHSRRGETGKAIGVLVGVAVVWGLLNLIANIMY